jgi:NhaP-type Na+/H+ or K+/H+ antiporter
MTPGLAIVSVLIVLYASLALWLGRRSISMPMVFVVVGFLLGPGVTGILSLAPQAAVVKWLTELTLALLLFADASTLDLQQVRADAQLPLRLLTIGLIGTIALGAVLALLLFPAQGLAFAALLGAILAPTDAALGLPIFNNRRIPVRLRRALNVESGMNDGIAAPFVSLFLASAVALQEHTEAHWLGTVLVEIGLAILVGLSIGGAGGWLVTQTTSRGWTSGGSEQLAILALGLSAYFGAVAIHGNGFIAAFAGGLTFGAATRNQFAMPTEFTETFSTFLSLLVWGIFGAVLVTEALRVTNDWRPIAYAVLSLTLVRMLPVALALLGARLRPDTVALMGWFGPRGLASVVFTLLAIEQFQEAGRPVNTLMAVATWTILLSVVAHGLSAQPLSAWYARRLRAGAAGTAEGQPVEMEELANLPELRVRHATLSAHRARQ